LSVDVLIFREAFAGGAVRIVFQREDLSAVPRKRKCQHLRVLAVAKAQGGCGIPDDVSYRLVADDYRCVFFGSLRLSRILSMFRSADRAFW